MKMTLKLNAPGMTSLHKAGLAGLYLTLRAFEETGQKIEGFEWKLEPTQVTLHWQAEKPKAAFEKLIKLSFRVDESGLIEFAGLETQRQLSLDQKYHLYNALLLSFLQYGKHRNKGKKRLLADTSDDRIKVIDKEFEPITLFRHQEVVSRKIFIDDEGCFPAQVEIPSWMFPGGIKRHEAHDESLLKEPIELAVPLLFAPIGVLYYRVRSRAKGRKALLSLVIPEIWDLQEYAEIHQVLAKQEVLDLHASSASDAALRFISLLASKSVGGQIAQVNGRPVYCRVVTFGIVSWSEQQKTRTHSYSVFSRHLPGLKNYYLAAQIFKNRWQLSKQEKSRKGQQESYFVVSPTAREFIADNIAQGRVWYHDLATFLGQKEARKGLSYERKGLNEMVEKASFDDERERLFISVCHESWRKRMGKLSDRVSKGGGYRRELIQKEFEKLRTSLLRSRNAHSLRQTVVDLWARAGMNEDLQGDGLRKLLPLFGEKNWRKTRDLALLALISYQPKTEEEVQALTTEPTEEGDEVNE